MKYLGILSAVAAAACFIWFLTMAAPIAWQHMLENIKLFFDGSLLLLGTLVFGGIAFGILNKD